MPRATGKRILMKECVIRFPQLNQRFFAIPENYNCQLFWTLNFKHSIDTKKKLENKEEETM